MNSLNYIIRFSIFQALGTAIALLPPLLLDPKLSTHVRYGTRTYTTFSTVSIVAICVTVFPVTFWFLRLNATANWLFLPLLPLFIGLLLSLPLLKPECPHGNVMFVGTVWLLVSFYWHWLHCRISIPISSQAISIEYIKAQLAFCQALLLGQLAAFLVLIVTAVINLHKANHEIVTSTSDIFLLNRYTDFVMGAVSMLFFLGPVYEIVTKHTQLADALLSIAPAKP